MTESIQNIPVVNIHADNFIEYWPALTLAIRSSTFIALDLEMSGIGNRKDTMSRCTEDRYKAFCEIAKTRSVLSLGISVFQRKLKSNLEIGDNEESLQLLKGQENSDFIIQTFNVMVLSKSSFIVEPSSLKFLVEHGFDFNKHYAKGIPYDRNDSKEIRERRSYSIRNLFIEILRATKPVILHNGILDLVFLYQSFYADLPSSSLTFLADLSEMFTAGIFDTKYIAEYHTDNTATFLNYIFKKSWRLNLKQEADLKSCVTIEYFDYPDTADVCYTDVGKRISPSDGSSIPCAQFAAHGHCSNGMKCEMSHDLDVILDYEQHKKEKKKSRKRKRKKTPTTNTNTDEHMALKSQENSLSITASEACEESSVNSLAISTMLEETSISNSKLATSPGNCTNTASGNHRAGFDAFMTGFCMATFLHRFGKSRQLSLADSLPDFVNKLNLSGKDVPLKITKSQYSKTSMNHKEMWKKVMSL